MHKKCTSDYTKPDKIKASLKRLKNDAEVDSCSSSPPKRRTSTCGYDEKKCLFCAEVIETHQSKYSLDRRRSFSDFASLPENTPKLIEKFKDVDNEFVREVKSRYDRITSRCSHPRGQGGGGNLIPMVGCASPSPQNYLTL